jgi:hypothetical protein
MFQQNMEKYPITIVVFNSPSSKVDELITFLPSFKNQINIFKKYQSYLIDK